MDRKTGFLSGYAKESMIEKEYRLTITGTRTVNANIKITVVMPEEPVIIPTVDEDKTDEEGVVTVSYTSAGIINIALFDVIGDNLEYTVDPRIIIYYIYI